MTDTDVLMAGLIFMGGLILDITRRLLLASVKKTIVILDV